MPASQNLAAWYPELWADEALDILRDSLVLGGLVTQVRLGGTNMKGDTVNFDLPGTFSAADVTIGTAVTVQSSTVTNVAVVLNKHKAAPFAIYDVEKAKAKHDLINVYLKPAIQAIAESIEDALFDEDANFLGTAVGTYGTAVADTLIPTIWQHFATNNVPEPWTVVLHPKDFANLMTPVSDRDNIWLSGAFPDSTGASVRQAYMGMKSGIGFFRSNRVNANTSTSPDEYSGIGFGRDSICLASANLPAGAPGTRIAVVNDSNFSLRIEVARQAEYSRDLVKVEALFGTKVTEVSGQRTTCIEIKS